MKITARFESLAERRAYKKREHQKLNSMTELKRDPKLAMALIATVSVLSVSAMAFFILVGK